MQQGFAANGSIKLSPSDDAVIRNVAFARRFMDVTIAAKLVARSLHAGIVVMVRAFPRERSRVPMN
jgi:hypothetical protein